MVLSCVQRLCFVRTGSNMNGCITLTYSRKARSALGSDFLKICLQLPDVCYATLFIEKGDDLFHNKSSARFTKAIPEQG